MVQSVVAFNEPAASNIEVVIFAVLLVALLARARGLKVGLRDEERSSWRFSAAVDPERDDTLRRRVGLAGAGAALVIAAAAPMFVTKAARFSMAESSCSR